MGKYFNCTKTGPVVTTKAGQIRGFQTDTTYAFYGIPYAMAERFQMPQPVKPWKGIRNALAYGFVCPLMEQDTPSIEVLIPHRYWPQDENCLNLNVWTQSLDEQAKKPVMVWLHGGGFFAGSSIEHVAYEGDHLSEFGDVVVVSVNHRLNILGYLDLSPFGEKYANSGNAGNADLVAALKWIQENIAAFGGDPENVTLFGQSGGGMKVATLMNTPAAEGLFHKGIIESGIYNAKLYGKGAADDGELIKAMLKELHLTEEEVEKLETIPYPELVKAYKKCAPAIEARGGYVGLGPIQNDFFLGNPLNVGFSEMAKKIPVIAGTVFGESDFGEVVPGKHTMDKKETMAFLERKYHDGAEALAEEFEKAYPDKPLADLWSLDDRFRIPTMQFIAKKSECPEAPTYSYLFTFEFPFDGGKAAWHCSEIPFVFHNIDRVPICNVPGVTDRLQEKLCSVWVNFARYGSPQIPSLPNWPSCTAGSEETMIFDVHCEVRHNFDHRLMELMAATPADKKAPVIVGEEKEVISMH
ncbi:MAG: carboxylesterase family protein [Fusicatenibacter sp.]|nr:carboxylesterase family protein [Lachnospiraceae bacterium]MDY2938528.1 carboxylesterase family protein [Fusicatenibacter sp.]